MCNYFKAPKYPLIYVFRIPDEAHKGCLKVGKTTFSCPANEALAMEPNAKVLNEAANKRIKEYTQTACIQYELLHTEAAVFKMEDGTIASFSDTAVHSVLTRSGINRKEFGEKENQGREWFITDLETVKQAIKAVKEGRRSLTANEITQNENPIIFRPEQRDAINKTIKQFKKANQMLWNAKMRFGKTLAALQVVKELEMDRTLILTHRPVVDKGWFEDFNKIFNSESNFHFVSKIEGETFSSHVEKHDNEGVHFVYFASMQDLRGSEEVGGKFEKDKEIYSTDWDMLIIDEAHEGMKTELGKAVLGELIKPGTKVLRLSGTPFNLLEDFKENEIYTWDYVMEQQAKRNWDLTHLGDPNPYAELPAMNIYTYDLGRVLSGFVDEDVAFNFREFFRVDGNGAFVHEQDVLNFLNLLTADKNGMYPFANQKYRDIFRHTLWVVPGVKAAKALSTMLQTHVVFQHFKVVNVAGDGDEDEENKDALDMVNNAIGSDPDETRTITLSCGRLTTGVTVKAWTGVLMLSGSYSTAASSYMQTIFRVQSPAVINGHVKEDCYVFDFAPDRTLQVLATVPRVSTKAGKTNDGQRQALGDFLNFCPVISIEGSEMKKLDTEHMLQQLKRAYVERAVRNGFEDGCLYNDELLKLTDLEVKEFEKLKRVIGQTKAIGNAGSIDINSQGLTNEEYEEKEQLEKKKKTELSETEKARLDELKKKKKLKEDAISILRGISIRMPLLIYGAEIDDENKELTIDNFTKLVDDQSWEEFMPKGVSKEMFDQFKKYYDPEIFSAAGKRIRTMARAADKLTVEERIGRITDIFSTFRNPDKETVLTPWRVVNMHLGDCLGGYDFFDKDHETTLREPRFIDRSEVTANVFAEDARILEINSKSGLYPLYMAYSIYRTRVKNSQFSVSSIEDELRIWDEVVAENIFVICKTEMAKSITKRTLVGFREAKVNTRYFEDLINQIKNKPVHFIKQVDKFFTERTGIKNMEINAIVGNPPYQVMDGGGTGSSAKTIYNKFVEMACQLTPQYVSMIIPSRWMTGGKGLDKFRESLLNDKHLRILHDYLNANDCFPNVSIEGGVCYFRWERDNEGKCKYVSHIYNTITVAERYLSDSSSNVVIRDVTALPILKKISYTTGNFSNLVFPRNLFKVDMDSLRPSPSEGDIKVFGRFDGTRGLMYSHLVPIDERALQFIGKWKVFVSKADGAAGVLGNPIPARIIGRGELGDPETICTETFLVIGPLDTKQEANNIIKYMATKMFRFLVGVRKLKNMKKDTYYFVPLQDFTPSSDIDWSKSVADIDRQLYAKYGLTEEEIEFIEKMIKPL